MKTQNKIEPLGIVYMAPVLKAFEKVVLDYCSAEVGEYKRHHFH